MGANMTAEVLVNKDFKPKTKPTIIFYHGFPDNKFSWINQLRYFEKEGYNVMAPPLRGYEESF
jgi:pimeloyl-ACP methyl ester carboxylesterase